MLEKLEDDAVERPTLREPSLIFKFPECSRLPPPVLPFDEVLTCLLTYSLACLLTPATGCTAFRRGLMHTYTYAHAYPYTYPPTTAPPAVQRGHIQLLTLTLTLT